MKPNDRQLAELIEFWQVNHPPLEVDGLFGPNTAASIDSMLGPAEYPEVVNPLPILDGYRAGVLTSSGGAKCGGPNKSRPKHAGDDWVYRRVDDDATTGEDGFGDGKGSSNKKWLVPAGSVAVAVRDGIVDPEWYGEINTGLRLWVRHRDGHRSGYFHATTLLVEPGAEVLGGQPVIIIGDNPNAVDLRHLHIEVSRSHTAYRPIWPQRYLRGLGAVDAPIRPGFEVAA